MQKINELELAKELIRFPSITPIDAGVMSFFEKKLKKLGFKTKIITFKDKKHKPVKNLYARLGNKGPNFCYAGHLDVVPPGNLNDWTVNPFKPKVKNGHLIGRGANDMKSSIAAFVSAVSIFLTKNKNFKGSISFLITGDEEGDAVNGTKKLVDYLKKKKEKINFCLVGEPTNPNGKLVVNGIQGHVAYPHRANNPSTTIIEILKKLKDIRFDRGTKNFQPTNLEVTSININNNIDNIIPGSAGASFNIRFNNKHSSKSLKKKLNTIFSKICRKKKSRHEIEYKVSGEAFLCEPNSFVHKIQNIIKKNTKIKPKLSTSGGTSDARFIRKISPCLEFGLVGRTMHKIDEAVSLKDLKNLTKIYSEILEEYFK